MAHSATYSPDDNKLRLYPAERLDAETYASVKAAGFVWAAKQQLFVAPAWTPGREDLLIELCGEIGDEDTSLVDRAEERAERFAGYSGKRAAEAARARDAVDAIVDGIPLGQPILVGHHSERKARKDAELIEAGMRKAVKLWDTSTYWKARAAGAIRAAKYKEQPAVRHRRIKTLEADRRKHERAKTEAETWLKLWTREGLTLDQARAIANRCWLTVEQVEGRAYGRTAYDVLREDPPAWTVEQVREVARRVYPASIARHDRWIAHLDNRLEYERAMLAEQVGVSPTSGNAMAERFAFAIGGRVLVERGEWLQILRVNRTDGAVTSITTTAPRYVTWSKTWKYGVEQVQDYRAPEADEWKKAAKHSDFYHIKKVAGSDEHGAHRRRYAPPLKGPYYQVVPVYITDAKRVDPPKAPPPAEPATPEEFARDFVNPAEPAVAINVAPLQPEPADGEAMPGPEPVGATAEMVAATASPADAFEAMRATLRQGVRVVAAPQLFPTPADLAERMVDLAGIEPGAKVLEPSAGTGALANAARRVTHDVWCVEVNQDLARHLSADGFVVQAADFLEVTAEPRFDRVVMNPPFQSGADIRHIEHAARFLKPAGRLVALCANGPRQRERLKPKAAEWHDLPSGTFAAQGTSVNVALLVIEAPED